MSFPYAPLYSQPLGWFKKPMQTVDDFKGLKYRTVGISIDLFTAMGAAVNALPGGEIVAAIDRGLLDAAEFNNASSDRALGFADVSKICMLQSYHQNSEQLEISFNKTKFKALPEKMQHIIENGVEAASQDMQWKAIDRNSQDYITLQTQDKVKFFKTPDSILKKQLELYDEITKKYMATNPLFKEIIASQLAFAKRATQWEQDYITQPQDGVRPLLRTEREIADLTALRTGKAPFRRGTEWCFVLAHLPHQRRTINERPKRSAHNRRHQHLGRQGGCLADHDPDDASSASRSSSATC